MKPSYYVTRDVDLTPCENRESISFSVQKFRLLQNGGRESSSSGRDSDNILLIPRWQAALAEVCLKLSIEIMVYHSGWWFEKSVRVVEGHACQRVNDAGKLHCARLAGSCLLNNGLIVIECGGLRSQ